MALGYCRVCDKLVSITLAPTPGAGPDARDLADVRLGEARKTVWVPAQHDGPDGRPCPGVRRPI